jgi:hypothetical protein
MECQEPASMNPSVIRRFLKSASSGWLGAGLLAIAVLLVCNVTLIVGHHTGRWDAGDFFCPYYMLIADHAREGQLLFWTPLVECGCPAGFDPEIGAMSPLCIAAGAILGPSERAFCFYWLGLWGLAGIGVLLFARQLGAPASVGCMAAIGAMFSANFTGQAEYTTYLTVMAALPWVLWRLEVALGQWRLRPAIEAGAIWGLTALSGYPAMIIVGNCYIGLWVLGRLLWPDAGAASSQTPSPLSAPQPNRHTLKGILFFSVFVVISSIILLPAYWGFLHELRGYSDRGGGLSRSEAVDSGALDPKALSTFASPYIAVVGSQRPGNLWATDVAMSSIYISPVLVILALAALATRPRDRFRWWLAALGLLCLAAAVGGILPLRGWLYDVLPPMRYFRHSAMFRCYYVFSVVALAIFIGCDVKKVAADWQDRSWKLIALASLTLAVAAMATLVVVCVAANVIAQQSLPTAILAAAHVAAIWGGVAVLMTLAWRNSVVRRDSLGPHLVRLCIADAVFTMILSQPTMFTNRSKVWPAVEAAHVSSIDQTPRGLDRQRSWSAGPQSPKNACLVSKVPTLTAFNALRNSLYRDLVKQPSLAASALGGDRIWFARETSLEPIDQATLRRLAARCKALGKPCLVLSDPAKSPADTQEGPPVLFDASMLERLPAAVRVPVELHRYDDRNLDFSVRCPADGWLLVTDRWAPGWQASVNDVRQQAWVGNLVFRAVAVKQGENHVCFHYDTSLYPWLLAISWLTLGAGLVDIRRIVAFFRSLG